MKASVHVLSPSKIREGMPAGFRSSLGWMGTRWVGGILPRALGPPWGSSGPPEPPGAHSRAMSNVLLPKQAAELLPWYVQWSCDLVAKMHRRCLVRNEACCTLPSPSSYHKCGCTSEWQCEPHNACFIHDSCFCPSSSSFPPVKPPYM